MSKKTKSTNILFITRKYPPVIGGMEKYSYDFYNSLKAKTNIHLISNPLGNKKILPFLFQTIFRLLFLKEKFTHIHLGDGFMSILIPFLRFKFPTATISITIHGLDITYNKYGYQKIFPELIRKADKIVCVSENSINECVKRGIPKTKCIFIPNGINIKNIKSVNKKFDAKGKKVLFSIGRLVKRKGHNWFVNNVMPKLSDDYVYLIAGDGPEKERIKESILQKNLTNKIVLMGKVSEVKKITLLKNSYLFIMPNIKIEGDPEGFGITIIEAGAYGLPVIASRVDGIPSAVINSKTGCLVKEKSVTEFINKIKTCNFNRNEIKKIVKKHFDWNNIAKIYMEKIFK